MVEAYWVGSPRLDRVGTRAVGDSMEDRFRYLTGARFGSITEGVLAGGVPHHSFAVFCIYPYTGLLTDRRKAPHALTVLDRCRIRWGRVLAVQGDQVVVECSPLTWDGDAPGARGRRRPRPRCSRSTGSGWSAASRPGDWVSLHWEWVCDRLTEAQVGPPAPVHRPAPGDRQRPVDPVGGAADPGLSGQPRSSVQPGARADRVAAAARARGSSTLAARGPATR